MNKIFKYFPAVAIAFLMISQTSCLKDEGAEAGQYGMAGFEGGSFVSAAAAGKNPNALALESKPGNQPLNLFTVNYENVNKAPEDIKVVFLKDDAAVTASGLGLTLLPASVLTFSSGAPEVTIAKGTRVSPAFTAQINTSSLDPTKSYGLAFTIQSVSLAGTAIPANLKTVIYKIALKNRWDGIYTVDGPMVDVLNAGLTQYPGWTAHLETTGPNTCAVRDMTLTGDIFHPIKNGGANSYYGTFGMVVTFDPATDKVTKLVSPYEPASSTRAGGLDPNFDSKVLLPSKNIRIKYFMFQPSLVPLPAPRVTFDETWTYKSARP